jgi:hypothetical protein
MTPYDEIEVPMLGGCIALVLITIVWLILGAPEQNTAWLDRASDRMRTGNFWSRFQAWRIWRTLRLVEDY